jgi:hypothetical protein
MERLASSTKGPGRRAPSPSELGSGPVREHGEAVMSNAADQLEELGLYLANERRLEKEQVRRRGHREKWMESKRRRKREG